MLVQIRQRVLLLEGLRLENWAGSCMLAQIRQRLLSLTKVTRNLLYASKLYAD